MCFFQSSLTKYFLNSGNQECSNRLAQFLYSLNRFFYTHPLFCILEIRNLFVYSWKKNRSFPDHMRGMSSTHAADTSHTTVASFSCAVTHCTLSPFPVRISVDVYLRLFTPLLLSDTSASASISTSCPCVSYSWLEHRVSRQEWVY